MLLQETIRKIVRIGQGAMEQAQKHLDSLINPRKPGTPGGNSSPPGRNHSVPRPSIEDR